MKFDFYFAGSKNLENLWTVLRSIHSATTCLSNSEIIRKRKLHVCKSNYNIQIS